jgi:hypothetical protein
VGSLPGGSEPRTRLKKRILPQAIFSNFAPGSLKRSLNDAEFDEESLHIEHNIERIRSSDAKQRSHWLDLLHGNHRQHRYDARFHQRSHAKWVHSSLLATEFGPNWLKYMIDDPSGGANMINNFDITVFIMKLIEHNIENKRE